MSTIARVLAAMVLAAFVAGPLSAAAAPNASNLVAQATSTNSGVSGTVKDEEGAPIANAAVTLSGPSTYHTTTDAHGAFSITNAEVGFYRIAVSRAGYDSASDELALFAGETEKVDVRMHSSSLTSLRTIASVSTSGHGAFNTSTAVINSIPAQVFADQAAPQVLRVLNQVPGLQISFPGTSSNGAIPGAITFPNIRGGLSFESASLIDGHPVSVGTFGDYVTTFLNSFMLGGVDVIKGPGAMSPQVNYAINGTVNFRTKDPTLTVVPDYTYGLTSHGGTYYNFGVSDTIANGRLGFVVDIAGIDDPSAVNNYQGRFNVAQNAVLNLTNGGVPTIIKSPTSSVPIAGTDSFLTTGKTTLFACCYTVSGQYDNLSELVKLRYKFSDATTATVSYLGSQTWADQNGNTSSQQNEIFAPGAGYTGPIGAGAFTLTNIHPGGSDLETNNEPILQAEVRSTLGNDTILARYYHAGIHRLINEGGSSPNVPQIVNETLYGTANGGALVFNGQTVPVAFFDYFQQSENDALSGTSFEYDHPFSDRNTLSFAWDATNSTTTSFNLSSNAAFGVYNPNAAPFWSITLPTGSSQTFNTYLLRDRFTVNDKLSGVLSLYDNTYRSTFPYSCVVLPCATGRTALVDGTGYLFNTSSFSHFDQRLGLEYRPQTNLAIRAAAGSGIAPPYLQLLSAINSTSATYNASTGAATATVNAGSFLKPETSFGYDLGADYRLKDGVTFVSADLYLNNLHNHFVSTLYPSGFTCSNSPIACSIGAPGSAPVYYSSNINLNNARFEGVELGVKRIVQTGLGYDVSGSWNHSYAYNLGTNFYCSFVPTVAHPCIPANYNTNLAIISGQQLVEGPIGYNGFSNQNVPIFQGNAEVNWHARNGAYAAFGETFYGKNNSLNLPPFALAYATLRYPLSKSLAVQISGDNIFNAWPQLFPNVGGGVPIPLAGGPGGTQQAGTQLNTLGPANYRFVITKNIGPETP